MSKAEASDSLPGRERRGATAALRTILRAIIALRAVKKPSWSASGAERMRAPIAVLAGCGYLPARVDHLERQAHESVHTSAWFCSSRSVFCGTLLLAPCMPDGNRRKSKRLPNL